MKSYVLGLTKKLLKRNSDTLFESVVHLYITNEKKFTGKIKDKKLMPSKKLTERTKFQSTQIS